jgi:hypothetical protein
MFFATNRRRPSRRFAFSFESLQTRITPSDVTGAGGMVETDGPIFTPDMYDAIGDMTMTMPTNDTPVGDSTAQDLDMFTMTIPSTSC